LKIDLPKLEDYIDKLWFYLLYILLT
jgi:hypothetical protein